MKRFDESKITDQKRLARGEQLLAARTYLRARYEAHHPETRILMMAGGAPHEEIAAIRELMPKAQVVAVDRDPVCLDAALAAGADEAVLCDLTDMPTEMGRWKRHPAIDRPGAFHLVHFDLMGLATRDLLRMLRVYAPLATDVFILTFSYGRDVVEVYEAATYRETGWADTLSKAGVPRSIGGRLLYLFAGSGQKLHMSTMQSVIAYRGTAMPMVSAMFCFGDRRLLRPLSFTLLEPGDFEIAVAHPDPSLLYACPQERLAALRRSHAALKAAYTRKQGAA